MHEGVTGGAGAQPREILWLLRVNSLICLTVALSNSFLKEIGEFALRDQHKNLRGCAPGPPGAHLSVF